MPVLDFFELFHLFKPHRISILSIRKIFKVLVFKVFSEDGKVGVFEVKEGCLHMRWRKRSGSETISNGKFNPRSPSHVANKNSSSGGAPDIALLLHSFQP